MTRFYAALVLLVFCFAAHWVSAAPYAYIAQTELGTMSVIDTVKHKKVATINVGGAPWANNNEPRWQDGLRGTYNLSSYGRMDIGY